MAGSTAQDGMQEGQLVGVRLAHNFRRGVDNAGRGGGYGNFT